MKSYISFTLTKWSLQLALLSLVAPLLTGDDSYKGILVGWVVFFTLKAYNFLDNLNR